MAEYWKSTPKYWCKYCKVYVRDTPFERKQHEATGRHQGGIQKSLRDLHRGKEQEQREKDRAKNEVARLTGIVSGDGGKSAGASSSGSASTSAAAAQARSSDRKVATAEDRKRQAAQLAAMGIAVPQEYRAAAAMGGEWQTVAVHAISSSKAAELKDEDDDEHEDKKSASVVKGVRKRRIEEDEDEDVGSRSRPRWGRDTKSYRGRDDEVDLDTLLQEPITLKQDAVKEEGFSDLQSGIEANEEERIEPTTAEALNDGNEPENAATVEVSVPGVVFKKRKAKAMRER